MPEEIAYKFIIIHFLKGKLNRWNAELNISNIKQWRLKASVNKYKGWISARPSLEHLDAEWDANTPNKPTLFQVPVGAGRTGCLLRYNERLWAQSSFGFVVFFVSLAQWL